jgi:glycosyltransferase involved in cell wall biosynthesis
MSAVLNYPGNMAHAQHIARALFEAGELDAYVTTFAFREGGPLDRCLDLAPFDLRQRLRSQLQRRSISEVPASFVRTYPWLEIIRTLSSRWLKNPIVTDRIFDRMIFSLDASVARLDVPRVEDIHAFEYTALASFERARTLGVRTVLHLPSLDSAAFEAIRAREFERWPQLTSEQPSYFKRRFAERYARRKAEIGLADLIFANSSLTARSHIDAGADPARVINVPYGAPDAIEGVTIVPNQTSRPLKVLWAGTFSLRKGAHYLAMALGQLKASAAIDVEAYGALGLPPDFLASHGSGISFKGSIPHAELQSRYEDADVLVFPTLSDGFGMVATEAMARGLPVITTDQAGAADLIQHEVNGLIVEAASTEALKDALEWCLDNRDRLVGMRYAALETARSRPWARFRKELLEALKSAPGSISNPAG